MALINITCPITWWQQCNWVKENCPGYVDRTSWVAWQIGYSTIWFEVDMEDAAIFNLVWAHKNPKNTSGL